MGITGSCIILAIILLRMMLRKAPKVFSYALWFVAGLRLICPFSISSVLSLFNAFSVPVQISPIDSETVVHNVSRGEAMITDPVAGVQSAQTVVQPMLPSVIASEINLLQVVMAVVSAIWAAGVLAMAGYGVYSLIKVYRRVEFATKIDGNIYECEKVISPFVFGFFRPKIYLPCGMDEKQREYAVLHEKNHIRRLDHIAKLVAFAILMLHWYNPIVWIGYNLMINDMEMSCDEKVLRGLGADEKKSYGLTLVEVGTKRRFAVGAPLSFGENVVEKRIVNILKYRKPTVIAIIGCVILCVAAAVICLTNPTDNHANSTRTESKIAEFIEEDRQRKNPEIIALNNNVQVAGVRVISDDGATVHGWYSLNSFSAYYYELLKGDENLLGYIPTAVAFEAKLDKKGNIVSVTDYEKAPDFLGKEGEYDEAVFEHSEERAKEKYKELYEKIKVYPTKDLTMHNKSATLKDIEATGIEVVRDPSDTLWLVIRFKNSDEAGYISASFEMSKDGVKLSPQQPFSETEDVFIAGGGNESLWLGELNMFTDAVEKGYYEVTLFAMKGNEKEEINVRFDVISAEPKSFGKPELTVSSLYSVYMNADEKIENAVWGAIYPKSNMYDEIVLNEESLKLLVKHINKSEFTRAESISYSPENSYYVRIETAQGRKYEAAMLFGRAEDTNRYLSYETDNAELFKILEDIENEARKTAETAADENLKFSEEPYIRTVVSDITSFIPTELYLEIIGMNVDSRYMMLTFKNHGNAYVWNVDDYALQKNINGNWVEVEPENEKDGVKTAPLFPNSMTSRYYTISQNAEGFENGRYRMSFKIYAGTEESANLEMKFDASVEFNVTVQTTVSAKAGEKIENLIAAQSSPSTFGLHYVKTAFSKNELQKVKELYNSFSWDAKEDSYSAEGLDGEQNDVMQYSYYTLSVFDSDKEFFVFVYSNGVVSINGEYYDVGDAGDEMYAFLAAGFRM